MIQGSQTSGACTVTDKSHIKTTWDSQGTAMKSSASDVDHEKPKPKDKPARKRLSYSSSSSNSASGPILSPLASYIAHQKQEIENQEAKIEELEKELADYTAERTLLSNSSLPRCSKCHRKERHNRLNCPYPVECTSALFCGSIDKHPDDKQRVKQKTRQLNEERKSLLGMKEELKNREKASASFSKRYTTRVKETLIESNPEKYLRRVNGKQIEDWRLINKDSKVLEKELKGRMPTSTEARETIEEFEALPPVRKTCTGKTTVHKPYKKLWQDRGILWPRGESEKIINVDSSEDSSPIHSPQRKKAAFASREEEDDFQLAMGMQKSLESLPRTFNLDKYEQDTDSKEHESKEHDSKKHESKEHESKAKDPENMQTLNLEVLAKAAMQLELEDLILN